MFYFERKIYYIDKYEKGEKRGNAGFINITLHEKDCQIHIGIRHLKRYGMVKCQWYGIKEEEKILLEEFNVENGFADLEWIYPYRKIGRNEYDLSEFKGFYFQFGKNVWGNCFTKREYVNDVLDITETKPSAFSIMNELEEENQSSDEESKQVQKMSQQSHTPRSTFDELLQTYPVVQPFPAQGEYVQIEPVTLKVLAQDYRKLTENSFLLHGYYTHKHIILGFYKDEKREGYYLGVPGSFEPKEQIMAEMFGFEGYERSGDMGYYMRRVEF